MTEQSGIVQDHWTREGVLARIDAVLLEMGHDPEAVTPEILSGVEHLHTGGLTTTQDQAEKLALGPDARVLDIGCGIGGPARYLAHTYGCRVDGVDLTPELLETGQVLTRRCGLEDKVTLQLGDALDLSFPDQSFDVVWCQNVTMNIADKAGFLGQVHRVLKPGGKFASTEYSTGPGGDIIYPVTWAYDPSTNFLDSEHEMRAQFADAGFRILDWTNYTGLAIERLAQARATPSKLANHLVFGEDTPERAGNGRKNMMEKRIIYWMITAERN
ncbi:MAG: methyltransferase domain-containing protein [Rhodospirillaceae bacterium]|nr:methyltransferase domain-containing protein [Rhodospirillaceae bacterium]